MINGTLTARKANDSPTGYRVVFDDGTGPVEVGSVSERTSHTQYGRVYWRWGVDVMPLTGGHVPSGETWSREAALAFRSRRPKTTPIHELERSMRCRQCSERRGYPFKQTHLVALRTTKITASDPPSYWWPGERNT